MNEEQIRRLFSVLGFDIEKKFVGFFFSDEFPEYFNPGQFLIFHSLTKLDSRYKTDGHWTLLLNGINGKNQNKNQLIFIDSYGRPPSNESMITNMLTKFDCIWYNSEQLQSILTNVCGLHCTKIVYFWLNGDNVDKIIRDKYQPLTKLDDNVNDLNVLNFFKDFLK